jgi:phospholipid-binding lipoprotein MlaA
MKLRLQRPSLGFYILMIWVFLATGFSVPLLPATVSAAELSASKSLADVAVTGNEPASSSEVAVSQNEPNPEPSAVSDTTGGEPSPIDADNPSIDDLETEDELDAADENQNNGNGPQITDPIEPFNRAMYQFNDKLYFWVLKPVATGYNKVLPKVVRVSVKNFFTNLAFPIRFVSSLLQADFSGTATEAGRFFINSIWGIAGFIDLASMEGVNLPKQDADLGQTFGLWGVGQGFYIVWPFWGPSSPRDTFGSVGEYFLYPVSYLSPWYASTGVKTYEIINDTSLRIGDYEALIGAAIDPYIAIRDAYVQYRHQKIEKKRQKLWSSATEEKKTIQ